MEKNTEDVICKPLRIKIRHNTRSFVYLYTQFPVTPLTGGLDFFFLQENAKGGGKKKKKEKKAVGKDFVKLMMYRGIRPRASPPGKRAKK